MNEHDLKRTGDGGDGWTCTVCHHVWDDASHARAWNSLCPGPPAAPAPVSTPTPGCQATGWLDGGTQCPGCVDCGITGFLPILAAHQEDCDGEGCGEPATWTLWLAHAPLVHLCDPHQALLTYPQGDDPRRRPGAPTPEEVATLLARLADGSHLVVERAQYARLIELAKRAEGGDGD